MSLRTEALEPEAFLFDFQQRFPPESVEKFAEAASGLLRSPDASPSEWRDSYHQEPFAEIVKAATPSQLAAFLIGSAVQLSGNSVSSTELHQAELGLVVLLRMRACQAVQAKPDFRHCQADIERTIFHLTNSVRFPNRSQAAESLRGAWGVFTPPSDDEERVQNRELNRFMQALLSELDKQRIAHLSSEDRLFARRCGLSEGVSNSLGDEEGAKRSHLVIVPVARLGLIMIPENELARSEILPKAGGNYNLEALRELEGMVDWKLVNQISTDLLLDDTDLDVLRKYLRLLYQEDWPPDPTGVIISLMEMIWKQREARRSEFMTRDS